MKAKSAFIIIVFILTPQLVLAGAPFKTDDPEVVEYKHWEFYLASYYSNDTFAKGMTLPHVEINHGLLPEFQIHLLMPLLYLKPAGQSYSYGYGDTELGLKYRLVKETKYMPSVATFPLVEIPTGDESKGLGTGHVQFFLPLWLQKTFGPWITYGGGGYWNNPGNEFRNWWFLGWAVQRELSKALSIGAELYYKTESIVDAGDSKGYTIGAIINFTDNYHLLLSAGQDISGPNYFNSYVAFLLTF
jgi:hypothetical protein